ncbi:MAG: electron transport complex subunit RsxC [Candidatus Bathyarchaeota archaeon]|nr:electron transport complex subunit RsxC [Candidatus Bathyarchaeota archaeon]
MTVKIEERKEKARKVPIEVFPDPKTAVVLILQHVGASNVPLVSEGDKVSIGQKIADSEERISAPVHSPISGKVEKIGDAYNIHQEEFSEAIFIENDGKKRKDKTLQPISESELKDVTTDFLIERIREAGIIGLGGAGFPTHVKLSPPSNKPIKYLVVNACESEIYDTSDERLLVEKTSNILKGVRVIRKVLGSPEVVIATKNNKIEALEKLKEVFSEEPETRIVARPFAYQQGDAGLLQKELFGWEVPAGKRSYEMGVIVHNVATINAVAKAVFEGEPLISRVTTLTGDIEEPKNLLVKIGTPVGHILDHFKVDPNDVRKVVLGGVMMGAPIPTTEAPVTKRTSSIIVFSKSKYKPVKRRTDCIKCSKCISACPLRLHPISIFEAIEKGDIERAKRLYFTDCFRCGICSYVCPTGIPLAQTICGTRY